MYVDICMYAHRHLERALLFNFFKHFRFFSKLHKFDKCFKFLYSANALQMFRVVINNQLSLAISNTFYIF